MKELIVYYSLNGNTDSVARRLAARLGADLLELKPQKAYPDKGFRKFFWGGKSAVMGERPALEPYVFNACAYDRVIFGSPVWAGTYAPPLRTFLGDNAVSLKGKRFAAFLCCSGGDTAKTFEKLRVDLGVKSFDASISLIDPKDKPTPGNEQKLDDFVSALQTTEEP